MTHNNNRTITIRYLLITSGVLVVGGLGYLAYTMLQEQSNEVRFYESEQQCIADAMNQKNGFTKQQCQTQFLYAKQEYDRITPVYSTQQECQEDTASICSQISNSSVATTGWRPDFSGFYFTDDVEFYFTDNVNASPTVVNSGSSGSSNSYAVYHVQPVYRSHIGIVTPDRAQIARPLQGVPLDSPYFSPSRDTPSRPQGYAAQGTIKGRGSFGNFVRSIAPIGSGGK
ncbi:MAG: DUF1190 domain-containing protein [Microcoleus sp. CSU_2_2]|nr:DUF1190 domain-containing protein [Microcoleus sp. SU_5_3]NJS10561.1 DUF1190 domain-containing protein [Microcoleus sp. CSU_2_2]